MLHLNFEHIKYKYVFVKQFSEGAVISFYSSGEEKIASNENFH
jgi:hypothetical protein